ncbi:hypothetical protein EsDP_00002219 [Epichloe bromicola]|uniref:EamA domain-containing protein n=1 Tax=Epichloe bromicola TaxID=79588 RepID=A0ABQ0CK65_9HYPO
MVSQNVAPSALSPTGRASDKAYATKDGERGRLLSSPAPSGRLSPVPHGSYHGVHLMTERKVSMLSEFWIANKPSILVALSQLFAALMNLSARFLELEGDGMHPVQMLLLRQSVTWLCCSLYMWWMKIPNYPFGRREIRWLLLVRGITGFFGIFGMWWSMMYLPLADATVITFLAPGVAGFVCYFLLREPFTRIEQLATLVALLGVILIAQPTALFANTPSDDTNHHSHEATDGERPHSSVPGADHHTTPHERLLAVGVALLGVLGAAGAFTALRAIGKRAHPLISVNAFAVICTIICATFLTLGPVLDIGQPSLRWMPPTSIKQWLLLSSLGWFGFIMQYLMTAGLGADKSNRANAMVYTHMLFAASFDRWIFGHHMGLMSFAGCTLILGSAVGVIVLKKPPPLPKAGDVETQSNFSGEAEGSSVLLGVAGHAESVNSERMR